MSMPMFSSPEEMAAAMQHQQMANNEGAHRVAKLFETLPEDDMVTLMMLLAIIIRNGKNALACANYWVGVAETQTQIRFKKCIICGKDHDVELAELASPENP